MVRITAENVRPGHIIPSLNDAYVTDVLKDDYSVTITYQDRFYPERILTMDPDSPIDVSGDDY